MSYNGDVKINTKIDESGIAKGFSNIKRKVTQLEKTFEGATKAVEVQERKVKDLSDQMDKAAVKADKLRAAGDTKGYAKAVKEADKLGDAFHRAQDRLDGMKDDLARVQGKLDEARRGDTFNLVGRANETRNSIKELEDAIMLLKERIATEKDPAMLKALQYELTETEKALVRLRKNISEPITNIMQIQDVQKELSEARGEIERLNSLIAMETAPLTILRLKNELRQAENAAGTLETRLSQMSNVDIGISADGAEQVMAKASRIKRAFGAIAQGAKFTGKIAGGALRTLGAGIGRAASLALRGAANIGKMVRKVATLGVFSRRSSRGMNMFNRQLMRVALMGTVFMVLRRGLQGLTESLSNVLMRNQEFAASWNAIRVNMLTAFAPVWEVIKPALIRFMQILAQVTAQIARFMAILFGTTVDNARAGARALHEQAQAIDAAGDAAEKATGQLAGFDQINQLAPDSDSGGGGGGGLDFNVDEPESIGWLDELAERLRTIFSIADPEYWHGLGDKLAETIAGALMSIPWGRIQNAAYIFAINLASFLSGFLANTNLWKAVGYTIAQGLNTALIFLHTFGTWFDFSGVGTAIAAGANKLFETFDFSLFGATVGVWLQGLWDLIWSFVGTFDWGNIVCGIADGIDGFIGSIDWANAGRVFYDGIRNLINTVSTAIRETDWIALGRQLADGVRNFIGNHDWVQLVRDLAHTIGMALGALAGFLWGFIQDAVRAIGDYFMQFFGDWSDMSWWEIGWDIFTGILEGIVRAVVGIGQWIWNNIFLPLWDGIRAVFGINSPSTRMMEIGVWLIEGLLQGLMNVAELIIGFFVSLWNGIVEIFSVVRQWFGDMFSGAWQAIQNTWNVVVEWFRAVWDGIVRIFIVAARWYADRFREAWQGIQHIWSVVVSWFREIWNGIVAVFSVVRQWFTDRFREAWQGIQNVWNVAVNWFRSVWDGITGIFRSVGTWFTDRFREAWNGIVNIFGGLANWFNVNVWQPIVSLFTTIGTAVGNAIDGAVRGAVNAVLNFAGNAINGFIGAINTAIGIINLIPNVTISTIPLLNIPQLARGGVVDGATIAMIGEKGREAVVPLENNTGWLNEIANKLNELQGNKNNALSAPVEIVLELDRCVIGRVMLPILEKENQRRGIRIQARAVV